MGIGASVAADTPMSQPVANESALATRKLSHGVSLLSKNPRARKEFIKFLRSGEWIDELCSENRKSNPNHYAIQQIMHDLNQPDASSTEEHPIQKDPETTEVFCEYALPMGKTRAFVDSRFATTKTEGPTIEEKHRDAFIETYFTSPQLKTILMASVFPIFLRRTNFQDWNETENDSIQTPCNSERTSLPAEVLEGREERLDELFQPRERRLRDIISQALETVDIEELGTLLSTGSWLEKLIATVEELPLCVSLASARQDRRGFPLVYVNKAFEATTGYDRSEITGHNCKFLQSTCSEPSQIAKMQYALGHALPVKVALTNTRKDGMEFFNLLAMKPVFDAEGQYAYVIGVQYDITNREATMKEMKMVDDLLSILPNILQ